MKSKLKLFALSLLLTTGAMLGFIFYHRPVPPSALAKLKRVAPNLFITSQIEPTDLIALRRSGLWTIVDLRPDGEEAGQVPSDAIEREARARGFQFHYIPVPHGDIPERAVSSLAKVLLAQQSPTLLYCRSGRRAVRTLALVQASQTDGPSAQSIRAMVLAAGFPDDDLQAAISQRIAQRSSSFAAPTP